MFFVGTPLRIKQATRGRSFIPDPLAAAKNITSSSVKALCFRGLLRVKFNSFFRHNQGHFSSEIYF
jgi:hypothetical protein